MICLAFFEKLKPRRSLSRAMAAPGLLIGFESEEDWFEYRLEHDPRFLRRIEQARTACAQDVGPGSKTSKANSGTCTPPSGCAREDEQVVG